MKIICNKNDFSKAINIVLKAIPTNTTMPILNCILIDASFGEITLTANNMELGIKTVMSGEIVTPGKIAIEAKFLADLVRKLPENEITLETDDNFSTKITSENSVIDVPSKEGADFSYLPDVEKDNCVAISHFTLKEIIRQTAFSIGINESNKILTGELFEISDNNKFKVVSLDRFRASIRKITLADDYAPMKSIIPGKTLNEISKIISDDTDNDVKMYFTRNHVLMEFDETTVVSRLIEGEFMDVNQMISKMYNTKVNINRKELLEAMDRSTLFVKESDIRPVILTIKDGTININIESTTGKMNENLSVEMEGQDIKIGFNPKLMIDTLRVIDDETVSLYFINAIAPCTIKNDNEDYIYLVTPINF